MVRRIVETNDVCGLESLLGEVVELFCCRYIYRGTLVGVNDYHVELGDDSGIVYETGPLTEPSKDFQRLPNINVTRGSIESFVKYPAA